MWEGLEHPYRTIVADPPWRRYDKIRATKATVEGRYSTMSLDEIMQLPVADLADRSCHLWLWTTNAFIYEAHLVCRAWGFAPLTMVTWCKRGPGVGHYLRNNTEHVILASRGPAQVPAEKPLSTWYEWPSGPHSTKPDAFYDLVEQVSPGPRCELFARAPMLGWDHWGHGLEMVS